MTLLRLLLLALLLPTPALAQGSMGLCARVPTYIGCLPPATSTARTNTVPLAVGDNARRASIAQILGQMQAADIAASLGFAPANPTAGAKNLVVFGADPTGVADSTPAFNAACAALGTAGGAIVLPPGIFNADGAWVCTGKAVSVSGAGAGATRIRVKHTGAGLTLLPGDLLKKTVVQGLSFIPAAATPIDAAIVISYPGNPSWPYETTLISNVQVEGDFTSAVRRFNTGARLDGLWYSRVQGFAYWGGPPYPATTGTRGIQVSNTFEITFDQLRTFAAEIGLEQTAYSEAIHLNQPTFVGNDYGVVIQDTPSGRRSGFNHLSFYMRDGECDVRIACALLTRVITGYIRDTRIHLREDGADHVGIDLLDTRQVGVSNVTFESTGVTAVAKGVHVRQLAGYGTANTVDNMRCFATTQCVIFGPGTRNNVLTNSINFGATTITGNGTFNPGFGDESGQNFLSFIGGTGQFVIDRWVSCAVQGIQSGTICQKQDLSLTVAP